MSNKDNKSCASTRIKRNMNKIFVYGTLKSTKIQKELFGKELKMYEAVLEDYAVYEASDGWYFIKEKVGTNINGYIIELDNKSLEICDAFEYCPIMYQRKSIFVKVQNKEIQTYVYIRVDDIKNYKEASNFKSFSKFDEEFVINTEIKKFKEIEHPEFYK